ncbi:uncharacterized protein METZ01_LOCUS269479, partial [marine metagenome]
VPGTDDQFSLKDIVTIKSKIGVLPRASQAVGHIPHSEDSTGTRLIVGIGTMYRASVVENDTAFSSLDRDQW